MPTYNYLCDACRHEFEREQRISEAPIRRCPRCDKLRTHRVITNGNFILKGGGWYADGYGTNSKHGGASKQSEVPAPSGSSGESSKTGKPEKSSTDSASSQTGT